MRRFFVFALAVLLMGGAARAEFRTWKDVTGKFSVEAELVTATASSVILKTKQGRQITVPTAKLSDADRDWLTSQLGTTSSPDKSRPQVPPRDVEPPRGGGPTANVEQITQAMKRPVSFEFVETPLQEVVDFLKDLAEVEVVLDKRGLEDIGLSPKLPITAKVARQPLGVALAEILKPHTLDWVLRDEVVFITINERADELARATVYRLLKRVDQDALVDDITSKVRPDSWSEVGGPGVIESVRGAILVTQSRAVQSEITEKYAEFLQPQTVPANQIRPKRGTPEAALRMVTTLEFIETPLEDTMAYFSDLHGVPIKIDVKALDDIGYGPDVPITANLRGIQLRSALNLILDALSLTFTITEKEIIITTPEAAEAAPHTVTYPVADLAMVMGAEGRVLRESVKSVVQPHTWDEVGGQGAIAIDARGNLTVKQTLPIHQEIGELLRTLRQLHQDMGLLRKR